MKILICLSRFPYPLNKGDKLRAFNQIRELSKRHEVFLFCFSRTLPPSSDYEKVAKYCKKIHIERLNLVSQVFSLLASLVNKLPLQVAFFTTKKAKREFLNFAMQNDIQVSYYQFVRTAEYAKIFHGGKTLDYQDCLSTNMQRRAEKSKIPFKWIFSFEANRLRIYEKKVADFVDALTIITLNDRNLLTFEDKNRVEIIENGIDESYLNYSWSGEKEHDIIFSGNMSYAPNVDAAKYLVNRIMPIVWREKPNTRLALVGSNPSKEVKSLQGDKVLVTGWVEDMREYYAKSRVFIAPMLIGTGLQNKLLEAMSLKIPSITTPLANKALMAKDSKEILVGDSAEQLAENILKLLTDKSLADEISENAYNFVCQNYSWENSTQRLEKIILNTKNQQD